MAGFSEIALRFGASLLDVAFPSACVSCGRGTEGSAYASVCGSCAGKIPLIRAPKCLTCGFPFFGDTDSRPHCMHCEHLRPEFGQGWTVSLFRGPVRAILHALKYDHGHGMWALREVRTLLKQAEDLAEFLDGSILVPVPLSSSRLRERGYNQAELIAREVASVFPGTRVSPLLRRHVDTASQTQFNRQERIRNLRNAFSLSRKRAIDPDQRYIVVDDVFTTGSTLNACASALRKAGARQVDVFAIGHG